MASDRGRRTGLDRARLVLSTGSLYNWALERVFALAAASGYDGVELLVDARMESYDVAYLRDLSGRRGVPILSVHTPFAERMEGWPEAPEDRVEQTVRLAEALGAETVVAHAPLRWQVGHLHVRLGGWRAQRSFVLPWKSTSGSRYAAWLLREMPKLQASTVVRITVENMPHRALGRRLQLHHFANCAELAQFPYLVLDTTHWGTCGVDPTEVYRSLSERIIHVHLSDYDGREHRLPFKGSLALERLLAEMRERRFAGLLVIETEPWAVAEGDWSEGHLLQVLARCVAECRALLESDSSHSHNTREAGPAADLALTEA